MTEHAQALAAPAASVAPARAAVAAAAVTIPHAIGLGLLAYAPVAAGLPVGALALWSAALPGALLALFARRPGIVYAPTTVVALLFAAVLATIHASADALRLSPAQQLAACGATVVLSFAIQWLFGALRLASLARFLPVSVMHGFAAGVGLSMLVGQVRGGFGAGALDGDARALMHFAAAAAVIGMARLGSSRWPRWPGLLAAIVAVSAAVAAAGFSDSFTPAVPPGAFAWPPLPDYGGVPWLGLIQRHGTHLVSLALLMAVVNSLDVLVFNQELVLEHGLRAEPNAVLRRESLLGVLCALSGLIPASTSASRTRLALQQSAPVAPIGVFHAAILMGVAATAHWWLHTIPMAALAGALLLAGLTQVPRAMWSRDYARAAPASWGQSWVVALIFTIAGGAGALLAGLVLATFVLLHASASNALRRTHLGGQVRSRRLRRAASENWLAPRMRRVAVIELQGVMSFGVAAHMAEQVRAVLEPHHDRVILEVQRVPAWDATALVQLAALARDLGQQGRQVAICGLEPRSRGHVHAPLLPFSDLDRALEWAEDELLDERPAAERVAHPAGDMLGELGDGMGADARRALEQAFLSEDVPEGACVFLVGDTQSDLYIVQAGLVTMGTAYPPAAGLRLAKVGQGMAFGEMAFLNGQPRTACASAEGGGARIARLPRADFDRWALLHPQDALKFLANLAIVGTRRLSATTRQLRAALE